MRSPTALGALTSLIASVMVLGGCAGDTSEPEATFGFNEAWPARLGEVGLSAEAGADTDRLVLGWNHVEPSPGQFNWRAPDLAYRTMLDHGLRPLFVITSAPCWAQAAMPPAPPPCSRGGPPSFAPDPAFIDDFASFTAEVARRYPRAQGLEIWNEPNLAKFWRPRPDPELYDRLLRAAADSVHETGSPVPIVSAGLSPAAETSEEKVAWPQFMRRMDVAGGLGAADAVGFHPYPPHHAPLSVDEAVGDTEALMRRLRAVLGETGQAERPIWVTEVGVSTTGRAAFTPDEQATALRRIYDDLTGPDAVAVVIVHSFFDHPLGPAEWNSGTGVVTVDGARKPAFCALAQARGERC